MTSGLSAAFAAPEKVIGTLDAQTAARLATAAGDLAVVLDRKGRIVDASFSKECAALADLLTPGRAWIDTVTIESRPKIEAMLAAASGAQVTGRRQVNHSLPGGDIPVRYEALALGASGRVLAIGHDLSAVSALQQKMMQTQQSLERDYMRLRQAEARYRLLFDMGTEPLLIVDRSTRVIREANPAATALLGAKAGALVGRSFPTLVSSDQRETAIAHLGASATREGEPALSVRLVSRDQQVAVSASAFRQGPDNFLLVRLTTGSEATALTTDESGMLDLIERLPDGFVLTDANLNIITANAAFLELVRFPVVGRIAGEPLGGLLGRPGIDMPLILEELRQHGSARNVPTIIRGQMDAQEEVEVSGVSVPMDGGDGYGFSIRSVARRLRDLPPAERERPRSVEQLTELVGRMSLKDIVRESTDLIERLCIEAALEHTSDNRASAAEILGVSRQSLYSKLHRHGLGNLVSE